MEHEKSRRVVTGVTGEHYDQVFERISDVKRVVCGAVALASTAIMNLVTANAAPVLPESDAQNTPQQQPK